MPIPRPLLLLLLSCCPCACGGDEAPALPAQLPAEVRPAPDTKILSIDGLDVTYGEVQPYVAMYDRLYPKWSLASKVRRVLDVQVLPLRFAQREFAAERAAQRRQAEALVAVAGNVVELAERAGDRARHKTVSIADVELPVGRYLFDREKLGSTSPPLELPQGFSVVGARDLRESGLVGDDLVDAVQVPFYTHADQSEYGSWLLQLRQRCADKLTWVHPDFRTALPEWLKLP